jgi:hypothetical protein
MQQSSLKEVPSVRLIYGGLTFLFGTNSSMLTDLKSDTFGLDSSSTPSSPTTAAISSL